MTTKVEKVRNPIIWSDVPDPSVIRVDDTYYMTSTTMYFTPGCPIMKSYDLVNWEIVGYVYETLDDNNHMTLTNGKNDYGKGSWASCLRKHGNTFYVSFVAYNTNKTYIFKSKNIEKGPWTKHEIEGIYHDMSILFDDDGRVYMVYGNGEIKLVELTPDATAIKPDGLKKTIIKNADPTGGKSLAEGAHIYKINNKYYIFIIAWPKKGNKRRIQVCFRSDTIDGDYKNTIVLDDDMEYENNGVAQGGIVDTPDGRWFALLFQDHGAVGRIPVLVPVSWNDDWPIFGQNGKVPKEMSLPTTFNEAKMLLVSDDFDSRTLLLEWQWNHNPDNRFWSLTEREGWLRLKTGHVTNCITTARNTLTQRTYGPTCSGMIKIDTSNMKDGDIAGIAALQEDFGYIAVEMNEGKKHIIMSTKEGMIESFALTNEVVYLKIDFDFRQHCDKAQFYYSFSGKSLYKLGDDLKMNYSLAHFTGYRFGIFNYATKSVGGYVDIDWFRTIH